jgi:4-hydroxy 2-oxovalerate aldolase
MRLNKNILILDCSLRDGGYYNNWDFKEDFVNTYKEKISLLPIDYVEIGYKNVIQKNYKGCYFYTPNSLIDKWKNNNKKIVLMLDEINTSIDDIRGMVSPLVGKVAMFRIATKPNRINNGKDLAKIIKEYGFEVGLNVMYLSEWDKQSNLFKQFIGIEKCIDYLYMADSFGSVLPDYLKKIILKIKNITPVKLGFHGHNNLEMGLINSLTAIENGVEIIDSSITGMGRGAGNVKTELILTFLSAQNLKTVDFESLNDLVELFQNLQESYKWGNNLAYMVSGANSIPQKEVMDLITKRFYNINDAIQYLGFKNPATLKEKISKLSLSTPKEKILIIGGGPSVLNHLSSIKLFIKQAININVLFSSARYVEYFDDVKNRFSILVGAEGKRLENNINIKDFSITCILPSPPHKITPYIPRFLKESCFELNQTIFNEDLQDSHLAVTLQAAIELGAKEIYLIGFDGYAPSQLNEKEAFLMEENQIILNFFIEKKSNVVIQSLVPTEYQNINIKSIYSIIE